jgi:hypothetical protein
MEINVAGTKVTSISRELSSLHIMIDEKQLKNAEYFNYSGSMTTNDARRTCEIKPRISMAKAAFNRNNNLFVSKLDLNLRKKIVKCYVDSASKNEYQETPGGKDDRCVRMTTLPPS